MLSSENAGASVLEIGAGGELVVLAEDPLRDDTAEYAHRTRSVTAGKMLDQEQLQAVQLIDNAAAHFELPAALLRAVAWVESRFRPGAVSKAGAIGIMQLMPGTARDLGVDPHDANENVLGGARFLKSLLVNYRNDMSLALAAYNAGPQAVARYNGVPPYKETRAYVRAITQLLAAEGGINDGGTNESAIH